MQNQLLVGRIFLFSVFLVFTFYANAQERPKSINDLKKFIGLNSTDLNTEMKNLDYPYYDSEDDEKKGPFTYKYYNGEEYEEIKLIINKGKVIGAGSDEFTYEDYLKILTYLTNNGFKKIVSEKMLVNVGLERVDLWVSGDDKWKVRIDYNIGIANSRNTITDITLTTSLIYGFEN